MLRSIWASAARAARPQRGAILNARDAVLRNQQGAAARREVAFATARAAGHPSVTPAPDEASRPARPALGRGGLWLEPADVARLADVTPSGGFPAAARDALDLLAGMLDLDVWLVTVVQDEVERVVVARSGAPGGSTATGLEQPWAESYCRQVVEGHAPRVAPRVRDVPAFAESPATRRWGIAAYVGVPLVDTEGVLFGTLCGLSMTEQDERLVALLPEVERVARLLSTVLEKERAAAERSEAAAQAYALAERDPLTGLVNRRGWNARLHVEEQRRRRRGHAVSVLVIALEPGGSAAGEPFLADPYPADAADSDDPDPAGLDRALIRVARTVLGACRGADTVARLGLTDLGVLAPDCDASEVAALLERVDSGLRREGLVAVVACGTGGPRCDLLEAWRQADEQVAIQRGERSVGGA